MPRPLALEKTLMTQEEVASRLGISRSRVGQLETSALEKLRRAIEKADRIRRCRSTSTPR